MQDREENSFGFNRLYKILFGLLAVVFLLILTATAYNDCSMSETSAESMPTIQAESVDYSKLSVVNAADDPEKTKTFNILLVGQDRRTSGSKNGRSDAMILCSVNQKRKTVTLISFLRDTYVKIPGKGSNRINAAYAIGGTSLLTSCIEDNFGITIDGTVVVDFSAFTETVDLLGGVDVELTDQEAMYLNTVTLQGQAQWDEELKVGLNHLNGDQALAYVRVRKIAGNDFGRANRQRKVLSALFEKVSKLTLPDIYRLMKTVLGYVSTDLTNAEIVTYSLRLLPSARNFDIQSQQIPAKGTFHDQRIDGMQVLVPDIQKNRAILEALLS